MLKFHFTLTDGKNDPIEFDAGRTSNWKSIDAMASIPDSPHKAAYNDFVWCVIAAEQAGKTEEVGIEGMELAEAAEYIADTYDAVVIDDNTKLLAKEKDAPLASAPAK